MLPARHAPLRLLGLSRSILIVDEVHAYDDYTGELLLGLLRAHASLGGSAIVLSATIPETLRRAIGQTYAGGDVQLARGSAYPLMTVATTTGVQEHEPRASGIAQRVLDVPVRFLHAHDEARARVLDAASRGQCVLRLCNTVREAIAFAEELGPDRAMVFHARYAAADRARIEAEVLEAFGKASTAEQRRGRILVATQVVEQSLDRFVVGQRRDAGALLRELQPHARGVVSVLFQPGLERGGVAEGDHRQLARIIAGRRAPPGPREDGVRR